jgi:hypothetical protein
MDNSLCNISLPAYNEGCDENHVNEVKTIGVDAPAFKFAGVVHNILTGQPVIIHAAEMPIAQAIHWAGMNVDLSAASLPIPPQPIHPTCSDARKVKALYTISNPGEAIHALTPEQREKDKAWHLQGKELEVADIPEDTKKLIAAEYMRLKRLHPNWKPSKAARKAGEKYNVKFMFE